MRQLTGIVSEVIPITIALVDYSHRLVGGVRNLFNHTIFIFMIMVVVWLEVNLIANFQPCCVDHDIPAIRFRSDFMLSITQIQALFDPYSSHKLR